MNARTWRIVAALAAALLTATATAQEPGAGDASLWGPTLRMVLGLIAVLAIIGGFTWIAKRLKAGTPLGGDTIQVVSGVSLGGRDKVVLLRVGGDEVLVGVSPNGIRPLHVISAAEPANFDAYVEATQTMRKLK